MTMVASRACARGSVGGRRTVRAARHARGERARLQDVGGDAEDLVAQDQDNAPRPAERRQRLRLGRLRGRRPLARASGAQAGEHACGRGRACSRPTSA